MLNFMAYEKKDVSYYKDYTTRALSEGVSIRSAVGNNYYPCRV